MTKPKLQVEAVVFYWFLLALMPQCSVWASGLGAPRSNTDAIAQEQARTVEDNNQPRRQRGPGRIYTGRYAAVLGAVHNIKCRMEEPCVIRFEPGEAVMEVRLDDLNWQKVVVNRGEGDKHISELQLKPMGPDLQAYMEVDTVHGVYEFEIFSVASERNKNSGVEVVAYYPGTPIAVPCPVLRRCVIELEPGEEILNENKIIAADLSSWKIETTFWGAAENRVMAITVQRRPGSDDFDAGVIVTTNRRMYNLVVKAAKDNNGPTVIKFWYPQQAVATFKTRAELKREQAQQKSKQQQATVGDADTLDFLYCVMPKDPDNPPRWLPETVYNNGKFTYIKFPEEVRHRAIPTFVAIDRFGDAIQVRDRWKTKQLTYVVDKLVDRGKLHIGTGRKAEEVWIYKGECREEHLRVEWGVHSKANRYRGLQP